MWLCVRIIRCRRMNTSHHTFDIPPCHDCRCHFSSRLKHLYNDAHPTASSHIPPPNGTGTGYCRVQDRDHPRGTVSCVQMCRSAHGISAGILCEIVIVFHSAVLTSLPPRAAVWYSTAACAGSEVVIHVHLYRTVNFCTVNEVSDKNVSHSHRGSIVVAVTHTRDHRMAIWVHRPRRVDAQPQL